MYGSARWYTPASGTFNRLDPFSGNLQDPQSLHKYLYVHGDPISGVDPTGLSSLVNTLGAITIVGALAGINGALGANYARAADRSPIWGGVSGGVGGLALGIAWYSRVLFKPTLKEALITGIVGGGLAVLLDFINGEFANTPLAYYKSLTHESFSWGAVSGLVNSAFEYEMPDDYYLTGPMSSFAIGFAQIGTHASLVVASGAEYVLLRNLYGASDPAVAHARDLFRWSLKDAIPGIVAPFFSFAASVGVSFLQMDLLGLRGLSGPVIQELTDKILRFASGGAAGGACNALTNEMVEDMVNWIDGLFE